MSTPLRSEGWSVRPSFVRNGPTVHITLLSDETGLTQLAGDPVVAWQTPWTEFANLQLLRLARGMVLFATAGGVRYAWRNHDVRDFEELRDVVLSHGGSVVRQPRRAGVVVLVVVVLLASLAGGLVAWLSGSSSGAQELADARAVNLTANDLPSSWSPTSHSLLGFLFPSSTQVFTSTPTTAPSRNSTWNEVSSLFQRCMGVSARRDRIYGAGGQMPDYQVSSKVFMSASGATSVASTTQYYHTTTMVRRDVAEMSELNFGSCFATSSTALLWSALGSTLPTSNIGLNWHPVTFLHGWASGGFARITPSGVPSQYLVMVNTARGHFEVNLGAITSLWPQSKTFLTGLLDVLESRMSSSTSTAA